VRKTQRTVQTYPDSFRITGLTITKSSDYESVMFGVPSMPNDDRYLFQTLFGLAGNFMNAERLGGQIQTTPLLDFANRFNNPNTPRDLRFDVPPTVTVRVDYSTHSHLDEGLGLSNERDIPSFLNLLYASPRDTMRGQ
jgi:hypothetical protein